MSVENENVIENSSEQTQEQAPVSALDEIFKERDSKKYEDNSKEDNSKELTKEVLQLKKSKDNKIIDKNVDSKKKIEDESVEPENKSLSKKVIENNDDDEDDREIELGKLRKALNDSQKWGHTNNKRLKSVVKIINSLKEQEILNEEEFNNLSNLLNSDSEEPDIEVQKVSNDPLDKLILIANKRVADLAELYEDDPLFNKKVEAFDFCIKHSSEIERDEILEEISKFEGSSLKLAKKMYQIGEKYYNENYKELDEAGGLKELVAVKNSEVKRMQRKIDKLERELLQYKDYDIPKLNIDELGDTPMENLSTDKPGDVLGSLMIERDRKRR